MAAAGFASRRQPRRGGVLVDEGPGLAAGFGDGAFGVVDHEFFSEGVDKQSSAAGDANAVGRHGGEFDGVADDGAPESSVGVKDDGVADAQFDLGKGYGTGFGSVEVGDGNELVEDSVVEHQEHAVGVERVLNGKKAL